MSEIKFQHTIRATKDRPIGYIENLLNTFVGHYADTQPDKGDILSIQFMKQDMRGVPSISVCYGKSRAYTIGHQKHFKSYTEMLSYIQGYIDGIDELRYTWQNQKPY